MTTTDPRAIVEALRDLPGVADADVENTFDGGMGTLRLGLEPGADEVDVAGRVGQVLRERFGVGVDTERVQLVEDTELVVDAPPPVVAPGEEPREGVRLSIRRLQLSSAGLEMTAEVTLGSDTDVQRGRATGAATPGGVQRAVADATLRAVEALAAGRIRFELDQVEVTTLGSERTVVAAITLVSVTGSLRLTGAATVREDVRQAVVRATLDAVNRRAARFLAAPSQPGVSQPGVSQPGASRVGRS